MDKEIKITKKTPRRGDDGYKTVSVRMKEEMLEWLDCLLTWCRDVDDSVVVGRFAVSSV